MDTSVAKKIVRETFQNSFDKGRFIKFIKELFNKIDEATFIYRGNTVPQAYQPFINTLEPVGKYTDPENTNQVKNDFPREGISFILEARYMF